MSGIQVNFQSKKFSAESRDFSENVAEPFATFEIESEGNSICVFLRSVDDARRLVEAAISAHGHVAAIELERRKNDLKELEELRNEALDLQDETEGLDKLRALLTEPTVFDGPRCSGF